MIGVEGLFDEVYWVRAIFQRGLAAIYLVAFVSALLQFPALLGERGLLPVPRFLARVSFREAPSIFHFHYSDRFFRVVAASGVALAVLALTGLSERGPIALSFGVWFALYVLYLSIVNVGQTFYGFGWESMLLEAGFFAMFLGPAHVEPSVIPIFALRFMLFRTELGAGLIKIRHDRCWRDLTCLYYHHETQPLPNPLSWYFHHLPRRAHRAGVAFSHFVQLVAPFALLLPQPVASVAGALVILHQLLLVVSGNYAWLNWLTIVLGVTAFGDSTLLAVLPLETPATVARPAAYDAVLYALGVGTLLLGIEPTRNLFSRHQRMNYSYNPFHVVNAYGAFGSVTRERYEIVIEGSPDESGEDFRAYELRGKPGDPMRRPRQVAPYHLRLDWLMWFLPLRASASDGQLFVLGHERWFLRLVAALLEGDRQVLGLFRTNPFPVAPPRRVRALAYRYRFTDREERARTSAIWVREPAGVFLPPVGAGDLRDA